MAKLIAEKFIAGINNSPEFIVDVNFQTGYDSQSNEKVDRNSRYKVYVAKNYQLFSPGSKVGSEFIAKLTDCANCQSRVNSTWAVCPDCNSPIEPELYERFIEYTAIIQEGADLPPTWHSAFTNMENCPRPARIPESRWRHIKNNLPMLSRHIKDIIRRGWSVADIFGCHKLSPENRYAEMGLLMLLGPSIIILVEDDRIVIRNRTGTEQSFYRTKGNANDQVMIWELN